MNLRTPVSATMLLGLLFPVLGIGCGGGGGKQETVTDFCQQYADAVCQVTAACGPTLSMQTCVATEETLCTSAATQATAPGVRVFTPGNGASCINMTTAIYKQTTPITPTQQNNADDACNYVFQGTVVKGAACTTKYDCAGKVICDKGVCAPSITKNKGDGCSDAGAVCATGSYCAQGANTFYTCVAKGGTGAICNDTTPCLETLRCSAGKCTDRVTAGGACTSDDDCVPAAAYCDVYAAGGTCDTGLRFAPGSASCGQFSGLTGTGGTGGGAAGSDGGGAAGSDGAAALDTAADATGDSE